MSSRDHTRVIHEFLWFKQKDYFPVVFAESMCDLFAQIGTCSFSILFVNSNDSVGDSLVDTLLHVSCVLCVTPARNHLSFPGLFITGIGGTTNAAAKISHPAS
ncbi:hypothetical protein EDB85DRAFT_1900555 [Lactarius pseudohatsudake]|nr:hypothetical protein EDB85DRAFT_1900555 [Lactarius pseudohatsudake]